MPLFLYTSEIPEGLPEEECVNAIQEIRVKKGPEDRDLEVPGFYMLIRASEGHHNEVYGINQGKGLSWGVNILKK